MACVNNSNKIDPEPEMRKSITLALFALFLLAGLGFVESRLVSVQTHPQAQDPTVPALSQPWADDRFAPSLPAHEPVPLEFWHLDKGDSLLEPRSALDVASASPFPAGDLVWAHGVRFDDAEKAHANIVLASRRQIDTWLIEGGHAARPGPTPELWAVAGLSSPIVVPGHGEAARATQAARGRRLNLALIGLAALLIGALAVTPTLQLRARAIAAGQAFESLHGRAAPAVAQRDQIVQQAEKATAIRDHLAAQADPVKVLEALTRATPDDAWILSLKVEGLTASLTGNAANAAALMRQLEQMPGAREVRATSAATRRFDGTRESFNIEVRLDPAVFGRLPPTEGAQK